MGKAARIYRRTGTIQLLGPASAARLIWLTKLDVIYVTIRASTVKPILKFSYSSCLITQMVSIISLD